MKKITAVFITICILLSSLSIGASDMAFGTAEIVSYAVFESGEKIEGTNNESMVPIGSVSKLFTATLTMKLCEEGIISLDGKVTEYLPEFKMQDERYKDITVRHLLNHTSGLFGSSLKNVLLYKDSDTYNHDNFLSVLSYQRLKYAPGEMANYCNDGYTLLELIIEKVTGISYIEYLEKVFKGIIPDESIKTAKDVNSEESINSVGAMGLYSDAETISLATYLIMCTDKILSEESLSKMQSIREGALPGETFGFGWDNVFSYPFNNYGIKALTKGGDTINYHSAVTILPEEKIVSCVILKDGDSKAAEAKANSLIIDLLGKKGINADYPDTAINENETKEIPEELKKYEGLYLSAGEQLIFSISGGFGIIEKLIAETKTVLPYGGNGKFLTEKGYLYFDEHNGKTYMVQEGYTETLSKESYPFCDYYAEKTEEATPINEAWKNRDGNVYLLCDEKYTSLLYMGNIVYTRIKFSEKGQGYLSYLKTVDDNKAECAVALPGNFGADLTDISVFTLSDKEYLKSGGMCYVSLSDVPYIYNGTSSLCTILSDGYTRWFKAGEAKGKKMTVKVNGNGMFALYNKDTVCVYSSLKNSSEITIPKGGYIAFSGDEGTVFEITLA